MLAPSCWPVPEPPSWEWALWDVSSSPVFSAGFIAFSLSWLLIPDTIEYDPKTLEPAEELSL